MEERARYETGNPLDRAAPADLIESIMRIRESLGMCRLTGAKMSVRQGQAELSGLTYLGALVASRRRVAS